VPASIHPIVAKAQDAVSPPDNGIFVSLRKAPKGDAVVNYREPPATKELRYHGLVRLRRAFPKG